jgi:flagella basal body P-ring formation protein FlgA
MNTDKKMIFINLPEAFLRQISKKSKKSNQPKSLKNLCSSVFICGLFLLFFIPISAQTKITIPAESKVESEIISLGDIAEISGEKSESLRKISLGYAPNIGMTREIPRERIILSIAAAGFSSKEFSLNSPAMVRISRKGQEVEQNRIRETVETAIFNQFAESGIEVRIVRLDLPEKFDVPVGKVEFRTNISNIVNPFSPFALPVELRVNDKVFRRFAVNVELEAFAEILVADKDLAVNTKLSNANVRLEKRRLEKSPTNYLRDAEKLRGIYLIKHLPNGAEITTVSFASSIVIKSGDLVRIVGQSGKMQIIVNGEARTSGKIGDRIAVKNSQSNAIIQATVVDEGLVKLFF